MLIYSSAQPSSFVELSDEVQSITVSAETEIPQYDDDLEYPFSYEEPEEGFFTAPKEQ